MVHIVPEASILDREALVGNCLVHERACEAHGPLGLRDSIEKQGLLFRDQISVGSSLDNNSPVEADDAFEVDNRKLEVHVEYGDLVILEVYKGRISDYRETIGEV